MISANYYCTGSQVFCFLRLAARRFIDRNFHSSSALRLPNGLKMIDLFPSTNVRYHVVFFGETL